MDLRLMANDLVGKEFVNKWNRENEGGHVWDKNRKFVIDEVYQHYVKCHSVCENGYKIIECFSVGDLVRNGILKGGRI